MILSRLSHTPAAFRHHPSPLHPPPPDDPRFLELTEAFIQVANVIQQQQQQRADPRSTGTRTSTSTNTNTNANTNTRDPARRTAMEEMLADAVHPTRFFWAPIGAVCGMVLGFILANLIGLVFGRW